MRTLPLYSVVGAGIASAGFLLGIGPASLAIGGLCVALMTVIVRGRAGYGSNGPHSEFRTGETAALSSNGD
jgi:hypothetical protein